jgi:hypothetical protein
MWLWEMLDADGEVGFWNGYSRFGCGFWWWLQLLLNASPSVTECLVCKVWAGWVEAEKFVEDNLKLGICESECHEFGAVDVRQPRDMVKTRWCGPAADVLMNLKAALRRSFHASSANVVVMAP